LSRKRKSCVHSLNIPPSQSSCQGRQRISRSICCSRNIYRDPNRHNYICFMNSEKRIAQSLYSVCILHKYLRDVLRIWTAQILTWWMYLQWTQTRWDKFSIASHAYTTKYSPLICICIHQVLSSVNPFFT
jgi:hypothetical protein